MDKILGLSTGADDYVSKPFNPLELIARIKSQLRRYTRLNVALPNKDHEIEVDELTINTLTHEVKVDGREVRLTPREFAILELLARHRGTVWSIEKKSMNPFGRKPISIRTTPSWSISAKSAKRSRPTRESPNS